MLSPRGENRSPVMAVGGTGSRTALRVSQTLRLKIGQEFADVEEEQPDSKRFRGP